MVRPCVEKDRIIQLCSSEKLEVGGHRKIGIPKLRWRDVIRKYMTEIQIKIEESTRRIISHFYVCEEIDICFREIQRVTDFC